MKSRIFYLVILMCTASGCSNDFDTKALAIYEKNLQEQSARTDKHSAENEKQLQKQDELLKRSEALIERSEKQADRYDALLTKWEKQAKRK